MFIEFLILWFWFIPGIVAAAGINAELRESYYTFDYEFGRKTLGISLLIGLLTGPLGLAIAFFMTGFFINGLSLKAGSKIWIDGRPF